MRVCVPSLHVTTMHHEPCTCCPRQVFVSQNRCGAQVNKCLCPPPSCRSRMWTTGGRATQNAPCARALAAAAAADNAAESIFQSLLSGHALHRKSFAFHGCKASCKINKLLSAKCTNGTMNASRGQKLPRAAAGLTLRRRAQDAPNRTKKRTAGTILLLAACALVHLADIRAAIMGGEIAERVSSVGAVAD